MGRVLLVHDDHFGRDIALKELLPSMGEVSGDAPTALGEEHLSPVRFSAGVIARFLQEARITGQLEHPSIVPVYELGHRKDGSLYYTMKLVRGQSLAKAIESCGGLEERLWLLPHFVDLCQAIAYAHSRSIVHRDIKPANVMVGEFGETVVLDWGLAKKWDREDVHEAQLKETVLAMHLGDAVAAAKTAYGQVLGTPVYMPPEQAKGELEAVDERSDVYSLGVVLYEILTGEVPFDAKSMREVLSQVIEGRANPIADRAPDAPPELVAIAEKAMALAKGDRYRSAGALAKEVQRFQSGAMVQAHRYNVGDYTRFVWRRYRPWIVTGAAAMVVLVGITVVYLSELGERNASLTIARDNALVAERAERAERERAEEMIKQLERAAYAQSIQIIQDHVDRGEMRVAQAL
jgi:serine/threonine protein kinase